MRVHITYIACTELEKQILEAHITRPAVSVFGILSFTRAINVFLYVCLFDFCFTTLQHILGHFGRGQLPLPHCSWASLLGSLPEYLVHIISPVTDNYSCRYSHMFLYTEVYIRGRSYQIMLSENKKESIVPQVSTIAS